VAVEKASPTALASAPLTWSMPGPAPRGVPDAPGGTVTGAPPPAEEEGDAVAGATALGGADEAGAGDGDGAVGVLHPAHTATTAAPSTVLPIWRITVLLIAVHLPHHQRTRRSRRPTTTAPAT